MYLIVSAFRESANSRGNALATAALIHQLRNKLGCEVVDYSLVTGVYKNSREVSLRVDLSAGLTKAQAIMLAGWWARCYGQETVALVDSGTIELVNGDGTVVASGSLEVVKADAPLPNDIDAWTVTTGNDALLIYSTDFRWHDVPK